MDISKELSEIKTMLRNINSRLIELQPPDNRGRLYSVPEFCKIVGITKYQLRRLTASGQVALPAPNRLEGRNTMYSAEDVEYLRKYISESHKRIRTSEQ